MAIVVAGLLVAAGGGVIAARSILGHEQTGEPEETASGASPLVATTLEQALPAITTTPVRETTTTPPTTTTLPPTPTTLFGDLNVGVPMTQPACDGSYVTFFGASVDPNQYSTEISQLLDGYPQANYLRTDMTCLSLRQHLDGNPIYAVFFGPFATFEEACAALSLGPSGAYVKRLDNVSDPEVVPRCG